MTVTVPCRPQITYFIEESEATACDITVRSDGGVERLTHPQHTDSPADRMVRVRRMSESQESPVRMIHAETEASHPRYRLT